ncbi:hypothetical protein SAMN04489842_3936 [Natronobacterium texcoconense]|uniref:Uncharacterized protein n=1 Tax=Natronobacterium texcoconense TaxID=1095778 RepID=A0A1H1IYP1_NATTX|nr:hypothetical protein SAMN04489842_3936 [Natronobacterium texcoconense]
MFSRAEQTAQWDSEGNTRDIGGSADESLRRDSRPRVPGTGRSATLESQLYRAVDINEATQILRQRYNDRIDTLGTHLKNAEVQQTDDSDDIQEVWSLTGHEAIESRTLELIDRAESEIALLVVDEDALSETLFDELQNAADRDLSIVMGGQAETTRELEDQLSNVRVFETGIDWLTGTSTDNEVAISRILLVDRETLLIGSYYPDASEGAQNEQAIFARGLQNGVVVLLRRLVTAGLPAIEDPGY